MPLITIVLFEDNQCEALRPVGMFRPFYEVRIGSLNLHEIVQSLKIPVETIVRDLFLYETRTNPDITTLQKNPLLFLNASIEPDVGYLKTINELIQSGDPFISTSGNRLAAALVPPDKKLPETLSSQTIHAALLDMRLPLEKELFTTLDWPHEVVESHLRLFERNLEHILSTDSYEETMPGVYVRDGKVPPSTCLFETQEGPVVIEKGVIIKPFSYLEGPIYIGGDSWINDHSSIKDHTSIGYGCRIGGEVKASSIESYTNKQHHGFLGNSWVGRWVNLGAGTTTSNLKNTYGTIRMDYSGNRIETGMQFLGSIIGDFVKTAINTSIFTGKILGVCSMIYGTVTKNVPSFTNYARSFGQVTEFSLEQVLTTQKRMFHRRGIEQTPYDIEMMKRIFKMTGNERVMSDEQIHI
ncbi:putative sugar nucleotidyl transferase [Candidatus Latescibacterota bacterium]